ARLEAQWEGVPARLVNGQPVWDSDIAMRQWILGQWIRRGSAFTNLGVLFDASEYGSPLQSAISALPEEDRFKWTRRCFARDLRRRITQAEP
ncbi:MAG: hypothetical protein M3328_03620, partial [Chloroflexota bacterium]|nr:hypothetical protein [Chloroflexota bacterium]